MGGSTQPGRGLQGQFSPSTPVVTLGCCEGLGDFSTLRIRWSWGDLVTPPILPRPRSLGGCSSDLAAGPAMESHSDDVWLPGR